MQRSDSFCRLGCGTGGGYNSQMLRTALAEKEEQRGKTWSSHDAGRKTTEGKSREIQSEQALGTMRRLEGHRTKENQGDIKQQQAPS